MLKIIFIFLFYYFEGHEAEFNIYIFKYGLLTIKRVPIAFYYIITYFSSSKF